MPTGRNRRMTYSWSLGFWKGRISFLKKFYEGLRQALQEIHQFQRGACPSTPSSTYPRVLRFTLSILRLLSVFFSLTFRRSLRVICIGPSFFSDGAWKQRWLEGKLGSASDWAFTKTHIPDETRPKEPSHEWRSRGTFLVPTRSALEPLPRLRRRGAGGSFGGGSGGGGGGRGGGGADTGCSCIAEGPDTDDGRPVCIWTGAPRTGLLHLWQREFSEDKAAIPFIWKRCK